MLFGVFGLFGFLILSVKNQTPQTLITVNSTVQMKNETFTVGRCINQVKPCAELVR